MIKLLELEEDKLAILNELGEELGIKELNVETFEKNKIYITTEFSRKRCRLFLKNNETKEIQPLLIVKSDSDLVIEIKRYATLYKQISHIHEFINLEEVLNDEDFE
jgi:hypothetical protein